VGRLRLSVVILVSTTSGLSPLASCTSVARQPASVAYAARQVDLVRTASSLESAVDVSGSLWPGASLRSRPIVVSTPNGLLLSGVSDIAARQAFGSAPISVMRKGADDGGLMLLVTRTWPAIRPYVLVFPQTGGVPEELTVLSRLLGRVLYVEVSSFAPAALVEMERSIVHEGLHLFVQQDVMAEEPGFDAPAAQLMRGRAGLEDLVKTDSGFRDSVVGDVCMAEQMVALIDQAAPVQEVRSLLGAIIQHNSIRSETYGVGAVEQYWCWLEGIPQYLDQQVLRQSDSQAWVRTYAQFCDRAESEPAQFYPALIGAAFAHALDYVTGNGLWKEVAAFIPGGAGTWFQFMRAEAGREHVQLSGSKE